MEKIVRHVLLSDTTHEAAGSQIKLRLLSFMLLQSVPRIISLMPQHNEPDHSKIKNHKQFLKMAKPLGAWFGY